MDAPAADQVARRLVLAELWALRIVWLGLAAVGANALADALDGRSAPVQLVVAVLAAAGWAVVLLGALVPSAISLTAVRIVAPMMAVTAVALTAAGASAATGVASIALALIGTVLALGPDLGDRFVQSSAYGHERRLLLRAPVAYLVPVVASWCVLCAAAVAGPPLLAAKVWVPGVLLTTLALGGAVAVAPRHHRLSRRWLVLVPAGVVVHDHLVLAETAMFRSTEVAGLRLAPAETQAADLTGPAAGHVVEIELKDFTTVTLAATRTQPRGTALHVRSVLVAPTRPGRTLTAAGTQGLPVG